MDLPTELRLQIAEYTLTFAEPLYWAWTSFWDDKRSGTFEGLEELTALVRVSHQLRAETLPVVWRNNRFGFGENRFGEVYYSGPWFRRIQLSTIYLVDEAYEYFLATAPTSLCNLLRFVVFDVHMNASQATKHLRMITPLALRLPNARFDVRNTAWSIRRLDDISADSRLVQYNVEVSSYFRYGRHFHALLSGPEFEERNRNWRIFPALDERDCGHLRQRLSGTELQTAMHWATNGI